MLRSLCSGFLPNGRTEILVTKFESWASVKEREDMSFDWDDAIGNARRRAAGLKAEALRKGESKRRRLVNKGQGKPAVAKKNKTEARKSITIKSY